MMYISTLAFTCLVSISFAQAKTKTLISAVLNDGNLSYTLQIKDQAFTADQLCKELTQKQGVLSCLSDNSGKTAKIVTTNDILQAHIMQAVRFAGFNDTYLQFKSEFREHISIDVISE